MQRRPTQAGRDRQTAHTDRQGPAETGRSGPHGREPTTGRRGPHRPAEAAHTDRQGPAEAAHTDRQVPAEAARTDRQRPADAVRTGRQRAETGRSGPHRPAETGRSSRHRPADHRQPSRLRSKLDGRAELPDVQTRAITGRESRAPRRAVKTKSRNLRVETGRASRARRLEDKSRNCSRRPPAPNRRGRKTRALAV